MEQEVNLKIACIAIQTSQGAGKAFAKALKGFVDRQMVISPKKNTSSEHIDKEKSGKQVKVKDLRKDGSQIEYVDMGEKELKDFRKYARKYGVSYSMEKNTENDPPTYLIYFKAKDSQLITKAIGSYVADTYRDADQTKDKGIGELLTQAKAKVAAHADKVKNKEKVR